MIYNVICGGDGMSTTFLAGYIGMGWNWIHFFQLLMIVLLLLPNIIYAVKCSGKENLCKNKWMNAMEQAGRYGAMFFMIVYFGKNNGFGFASIVEFLIWGFGSTVLLLAYWITWMMYFRAIGIRLARRGAVAVFVAGKENVRKVAALKTALVALPSCLFLLCGVTLRYIPLIVAAVLFAVGHSYVSLENWKKCVFRQNIHTEGQE